jgi:hypothetical protein
MLAICNTYSWFIHSFIQYFSFIDHQNFFAIHSFPPFSKKAWPHRTPILPFIYVLYIITFYLYKQKSYIITNSQHHLRFYPFDMCERYTRVQNYRQKSRYVLVCPTVDLVKTKFWLEKRRGDDFKIIKFSYLFNLLLIFYVLWRFWYHLMVTRSKGRYQYWCMITYSWFIHSFIQYFNSVDHQNFLRNTQLSRHSRKKHGRIEHQFYLLFMCFIL